jgi:hypothetical protein
MYQAEGKPELTGIYRIFRIKAKTVMDFVLLILAILLKMFYHIYAAVKKRHTRESGIQRLCNSLKSLDSRLHGNDGYVFSSFTSSSF